MRKSKDIDFDLINDIKEGDTSKFRILVEKYKDVSFSLACSILANEQDAEDALQESFVKAYKGLQQFKYKSSFSTWFYTIVVNTCKSKYRSRKDSRQHIRIDAGEELNLDPVDSPYEDLSLKERKELVNKALTYLKEEEALLLRLFYLVELSLKEIKDVTGLKESKIKVTLHRARKSFQLKFEKIFGDKIIRT